MQKTKAFTLVELLLGLTIFSVIGLCVYSVFSGGIRLSGASERQGKIYREARLSFSLMAKEIENMLPYDFSNSYQDKNAFLGEEKQITFLIGNDDGLKAVSYYIVFPEGRTRTGRRACHCGHIGRPAAAPDRG